MGLRAAGQGRHECAIVERRHWEPPPRGMLAPHQLCVFCGSSDHHRSLHPLWHPLSAGSRAGVQTVGAVARRRWVGAQWHRRRLSTRGAPARLPPHQAAARRRITLPRSGFLVNVYTQRCGCGCTLRTVHAAAHTRGSWYLTNRGGTRQHLKGRVPGGGGDKARCARARILIFRRYGSGYTLRYACTADSAPQISFPDSRRPVLRE